MKTCLRCRETTIPASIDFCAECCGPELRVPFTTRPTHSRPYSEDADVAAAWRSDLAEHVPSHRAGRHAHPYRVDHEHFANGVTVALNRNPKRRAAVAA